MFYEITTLGLFGGPVSAPGPGVVPVTGPLVTLAFALALAGPVPNTFEPPVPQSCQNASDNVQLQVLVVDQDGQAIDLSAATGLTFWLLAPDGTPRPVPAAFASNGLDGLLAYVAAASDLVEVGEWRIQAQVAFGLRTLRTRWGRFWVGPNVGDMEGAD